LTYRFLALLPVAFALAAVPPAVLAQSDLDPAAQKFIGAWRLVGIEGVGRGTGPGERPTGVIVYDRTGHVAVQISYKPNRPRFANGPAAGTAEEKAAAFDSYAAYYGTFTVDPAAGLVIHHLENSLNPSNVGKDNVRYYELQGNRMTLSIADDDQGHRLAPTDTTRHLIWERIEP
jgi:hypothetical protein